MSDRTGERQTVHVLAWRLLDYRGESMTYGGLQRWLLEVARLLREDGCRVVVHQRSEKAFRRELEPDLEVVGHVASARAWASPLFNIQVHKHIPKDDPVVYMVEDLAWPIARSRSVVVQHGIWWDGEYGWAKARVAERIARHAVRRTAATICVDTNFINWFRARWPESGMDSSLRYVPNFIDPEQWGRQPDVPAAAARHDGRLTICFPRRSEPRRGVFLMADVAPRILRAFPDTDFRFVVGSGYHTEQLRARLADAGVADRCTLETLPFDQMRSCYESSSIVVVPTICGEGTSLSAIEAMYFGCAVVSTWVGGLPNLVQDGWNGRLVAPDANEVERAIADLIVDPDRRLALGRHAMTGILDRFGIDRWRRQVRPILRSSLRVGRGPDVTIPRPELSLAATQTTETVQV